MQNSGPTNFEVLTRHKLNFKLTPEINPIVIVSSNLAGILANYDYDLMYNLYKTPINSSQDLANKVVNHKALLNVGTKDLEIYLKQSFVSSFNSKVNALAIPGMNTLSTQKQITSMLKYISVDGSQNKDDFFSLFPSKLAFKTLADVETFETNSGCPNILSMVKPMMSIPSETNKLLISCLRYFDKEKLRRKTFIHPQYNQYELTEFINKEYSVHNVTRKNDKHVLTIDSLENTNSERIISRIVDYLKTVQFEFAGTGVVSIADITFNSFVAHQNDVMTALKNCVLNMQLTDDGNISLLNTSLLDLVGAKTTAKVYALDFYIARQVVLNYLDYLTLAEDKKTFLVENDYSGIENDTDPNEYIFDLPIGTDQYISKAIESYFIIRHGLYYAIYFYNKIKTGTEISQIYNNIIKNPIGCKDNYQKVYTFMTGLILHDSTVQKKVSGVDFKADGINNHNTGKSFIEELSALTPHITTY